MQLPHQQQQLVEIGMDGLAKLWELFQEKEIWTVEKTLVRFVFFCSILSSV